MQKLPVGNGSDPNLQRVMSQRDAVKSIMRA